MKPLRHILPVSLGWIATAGLATAVYAQPAGAPPWVWSDMEAMVGRWVADNEAYQSASEPFDAYGLEWTWGLGQSTLKGRLFALAGGEEQGTFWEFRQVWHPTEQRLVVYQFGADGTIGIGAQERTSDRMRELVQTFHAPDGTTSRLAHRTELREKVRIDRSYEVNDEGEWIEGRQYIWRRAP